MRKLWYITSVRLPSERASSLQIMKMSEAFFGYGVNVTLVLSWRFGRINKDPFSFYDVNPCFTIRRVFAVDLMPLWRIIGGWSAYWIRQITFAISLFVLRSFLRGERVVFTRDWQTVRRGDVLELHDFPRRITIWHKSVLRRARLVVVVNNGLKAAVQSTGVVADKIIVAPNGVDVAPFARSDSREDVRRALNLPLHQNIVLYTGSLFDWKGAPTLMEAARKSQTQTLFVFVGGNERDIEIFKRKADDVGNVRVVGRRPYKEIPQWMQAADVLVAPNSAKTILSTHYTSPIKLFEYMASKRPIVVSDVPAIREILNEDQALFVRPDDADDLLRGIEQALNDREGAWRRVEAAHRNVQNYTWEARAAKILRAIMNA